MYAFLIKDERFLEKYNEILEKISNSTKNELLANLYIKKYLKTEIKSYERKINTKEGYQCICISVILIDSVYRKDKNFFAQLFLEKI